MAGGNIEFLHRNLVHLAAIEASSSLTPVARLLDPRPGRVWQAAGCEAEWLRLTWPADRPMTHAAIVAHTMDPYGTIRCRLWSAAGVLLHDTTIPACSPAAGWGEDGWGESLGGYPDTDDPLEPPLQQVRVIPFGGRLYGARVQVDLVNPGLAGGRIQVGNVFAGVAFTPEINFGYDWSTRDVDPSTIAIDGPGFFPLRAPHFREISLTLPHLRPAEAFGEFARLRRRLGVSVPLIVRLFPDWSASEEYWTTAYGRIKDDIASSHPAFRNFAAALTFQEIVR